MSILTDEKNMVGKDGENANGTDFSTDLTMSFGHNSQQGSRPTMEDAIVLNDNFLVKNSRCTSHNLGLFGVFDGHGGRLCASYCANNISKFLSKYLVLCNNVHEAIARAIQELDEQVLKRAEDGSGSTCTICLIDKCSYDIWVANVGDSRCILISKTQIEQLSVEHKPDHPNEKTRIEQADGWVTLGRVMGILAVSRALGDKNFKCETENLVVSTPSIIHHKITEHDAYLVLACDGLFDVYQNEEVQTYVNEIKNSDPNLTLNEIAKQLVNDAINVRHSGDNVSTIIVKLNINPKKFTQLHNNNHHNNNMLLSPSSASNSCLSSLAAPPSHTAYKRNIEILFSPHRRTESDTSAYSTDTLEFEEQKLDLPDSDINTNANTSNINYVCFNNQHNKTSNDDNNINNHCIENSNDDVRKSVNHSDENEENGNSGDTEQDESNKQQRP